MTLDALREALPAYARDLRLNLGSVLTAGGAPGLTERQACAVALASAIACGHAPLAQAIESAAAAQLSDADRSAARAAVAIMGMNNVYYRFLHLVEDAEYRQLPARLRMNVMANPGIDRNEFELLALAVSAINGCGSCVAAHERQLRAHGLGREAVQSAARIAAVIRGVAGVLQYEASAVSGATLAPGAAA